MTWKVPNNTDPTKMKNEFPTNMYEKAAGSWRFPMIAKTVYMRTRMNAPATGLTTEGSGQVESISQPSHAATLKVRQNVFIDAVRSASPLASRVTLGTARSTLRGSGTGPP